MQNRSKTINLKQEIEDILTDNIGLAIQKLEAILTVEDIETKKELLLHNGSYKRLEKGNRMGDITFDTYNTELNKLTAKIYDCIQRVSEERLFDNYQIREEIREKILIVCQADRETEMKKLFPSLYFPNTTFHDVEDGLRDLEKIKVVVFDDIEAPNENKAILLHYLKAIDNSKTFLLYYGKYQPYSEYSHKAYFSNSQFSIHARLKEMLDFIKYIS